MADTKQQTLDVATRAFERFKAGLATGAWQPFLDMLSEDFEFWFPVGKYRGCNRGRERAAEFFQFVTETFPGGLTITAERFTSSETTVVVEFCDEGQLRGHPYHNRVAVALDVRGDEICAYREYFGLITHSQ